MDSNWVCFLTLLLTAVATYGHPTNPPSSDHENTHVPHQPRGQPQIPPPSQRPPHDAAIDKSAQPYAPRGSSFDDIPCSVDYNCTSSVMGEYSICHGYTCQCTTGATLSETSQRCLRESHLGSGCSEDWQCSRPMGTDAVSCQNSICTCKPDAQNINGKCYTKKLISDSCDVEEECLGGQNTICSDHRCACKSEMITNPSNDKCLSVAKEENDPCEEDIQCTTNLGSGSTCSNSKCVCQEHYHFKNHACMLNLKLGSACGTGGGECFLLHDNGANHVSCIGNKCTCKDDRVPSSDGEKCQDPDKKDDGSPDGAGSVQPIVLTLITMLLARFLLS